MPRALAAAVALALAGLMASAPVGGAAPAKHPRAKVQYKAKARGKAKTRHRSTRRCRAKVRARGRVRCLRKAPRRGSVRPTAPSRPTAAAPPSAPTPVSVTPPAAPAQPAGEPLGSFASVRVSDSATNFSFALSRPAVATGRVVLQMQNRGEDPHDLTVAPEAGGAPLASTGSVDPGQNPTLTVDLPAGRYRLYCSLANHAQRGMRATLEAR